MKLQTNEPRQITVACGESDEDPPMGLALFSWPQWKRISPWADTRESITEFVRCFDPFWSPLSDDVGDHQWFERATDRLRDLNVYLKPFAESVDMNPIHLS